MKAKSSLLEDLELIEKIEDLKGMRKGDLINAKIYVSMLGDGYIRTPHFGMLEKLDIFNGVFRFIGIDNFKDMNNYKKVRYFCKRPTKINDLAISGKFERDSLLCYRARLICDSEELDKYSAQFNLLSEYELIKKQQSLKCRRKL